MSKAAGEIRGETKLDFNSTLKRLVMAMELPPTFRRYQEKFSTGVPEDFVSAGLKFTSAREYNDLNTIRNAVLDNVIQAVLEQNPNFDTSYEVAGFVAEKLEDVKLRKTCGEAVSKRFVQNAKDKSQISTIAKMLNADPESISSNRNSGANDGYIHTDKGRRFFIKTFSDDPTLGANRLIDPNEAFVYKVLEYMDLGPKTKFLIKDLSSGKGKTSAGNFILTEDVCNPTKHGEKRSFLLDDSQFREIYAEALRVKEVNIELSALSLVNDIMLLGDTFGKNPKNYGLIVIEEDTGKKSYKVSMIDHLPNIRNAEFPPMKFRLDDEPYSPRLSIQKRINSPNSSVGDDEVAINKSATGSEGIVERARKDFVRDVIRVDVVKRVANLPDAMTRAKRDIESLIAEHGGSFIENAGERLGDYTRKIAENYAKYQELERDIPKLL